MGPSLRTVGIERELCCIPPSCLGFPSWSTRRRYRHGVRRKLHRGTWLPSRGVKWRQAELEAQLSAPAVLLTAAGPSGRWAGTGLPAPCMEPEHMAECSAITQTQESAAREGKPLQDAPGGQTHPFPTHIGPPTPRHLQTCSTASHTHSPLPPVLHHQQHSTRMPSTMWHREGSPEHPHGEHRLCTGEHTSCPRASSEPGPDTHSPSTAQGCRGREGGEPGLSGRGLAGSHALHTEVSRLPAKGIRPGKG